MAYYDVIGLVGVSLILLAYALLQAGRLLHSSLIYSVMNGLGAGLILCSLYFDFNLSAALIESAWLIISLFGMARWWYRQPGKRQCLD